MGWGGGAVLQLLSLEQEEKNMVEEGLVQFKDESLSQWDCGLTEVEGVCWEVTSQPTNRRITG